MSAQTWDSLEQHERALAQKVAQTLHLSPIINTKKNRIVGHEFVTYVVKVGFCDTRGDACRIGEHLLRGSLIRPTRPGKEFSDDGSTYELVGFVEESLGAGGNKPCLVTSGFGRVSGVNQRCVTIDPHESSHTYQIRNHRLSDTHACSMLPIVRAQ